jgi:hypothetical protein
MDRSDAVRAGRDEGGREERARRDVSLSYLSSNRGSIEAVRD